ncbi:MAG: hypothetical protein ABSA51_03895 [Anaerolineaceae bacterium]|jgi:hypothetical protein
MTIKKLLILLLHAFIGWVLCAATIYVGKSVTSMQNTLIIHMFAAPIYFAVLSWIYFTRFNYTRPLQTALIFMGFIITGDFFVFALLINRSMAMFASLLGTWIPFALIFAATYLTGLIVTRNSSGK